MSYTQGTNLLDRQLTIFSTSGTTSAPGNLVYTSPNKYTISLNPTLNITSNAAEIGVISLQYTNSTRNVTVALNNNTFQYQLYGGTLRTVTFPDGYYGFGGPTTPNDINGFLQTYMLSVGDYVLDSNGNPVYFVAEELSNVQYQIVFTLSVQAIPAGGSNPNSIAVSGNHTPTLIIPALSAVGGNIATLFGIPAGTYGPYTSQTFVSTSAGTVPILNPVVSVQVSCPQAVNNYCVGASAFTMFTFPISNTEYGGQYTTGTLPTIQWMPMIQTNYASMDFYLLDQEGNALQLVDPTEFVLNFKIRTRSKYFE